MTSGAGHPRASFEAVLSSLRRRRDVEVGRQPSATAFRLAEDERTMGFAAIADVAFEDIGQERTEPLPSDATDAIASELALSGIADPERLRALRRRFMWANHPDRRPDLPRALADRRVAIANMLIDRALRVVRADGRRGPRE